MKPLKVYVDRIAPPLAGLGTMILFCVPQVASWAREQGWINVALILEGYWMGFMGAFAGFVAHLIYIGKGGTLVDAHPVFKWFSYLGIALILLMGVLEAYAKHSAAVPEAAKFGIGLGAAIVTLCLVPLIKSVDSPSRGRIPRWHFWR